MRKVLSFVLAIALMLQPSMLFAQSEGEANLEEESTQETLISEEDENLPEDSEQVPSDEILIPDDLDPDFLIDPEEGPENVYGWNGQMFYSLVDGSPVYGWLSLNDELYYFNENGLVTSQTLVIDGQTYRFDEQGKMIRGYVNDGNHHYYSLYDGTQQNGVQFYDDHLYVLNGTASGAQNIAGQDVYVLDNQELLTDSSITVDGNLYYYLADGSRARDLWKNLDGEEYYFNEDGIGILRELNDNEKAANAIIEQVGADLYAAFSWVVDTFTYRKDVFDRTMDEYAQIGFNEQQGNCFTYASCFYYLAKQLGYTARYVHGLVKFYTGQVSEHGWVMITEGDKEWIYDAEAEAEIGKGVYHFWRVDPLNPIIGYRFPEGEEPLGGYTVLY